MNAISRYKVTVDGITYHVQVEDETGEVSEVRRSDQPAAEGGASGKTVEVRTHLPGNIYEVLCAEGDRVKKGETVVILEAMKMESPIYATEDGVVKSVEVSKGQTVTAGQVLVTLG
ncbi:biotin/lipoyl-binding protein [Desulfobulbus rhabdoformis]|uniref:biotin/lipoyl-containing protein n=1 Tax=Desulfobulbus rhabdoformis TaxID=34032 RepID=UPI001963DDE6|nr:biotin/lipoyl-containing protein [Desulfobulbus rhabdoformis]MBM9612716.1 biotin/lipoyl-binding protein [Desulfobulbus rhabdoformis]